MVNDEEIYFTRRIAKAGGEVLIIKIPKDEKRFEYKDLVKITLLRKADKDAVEEDDDDEKPVIKKTN